MVSEGEGGGPLREVGFFRELSVGSPDGPSLYDAMQRNAHPDEALLVAYLRGGSVLATTGKAVADVVSGEPAVALLEIRTDGVWVWPAELAHYVERHHVRLPDGLLARATAVGGAAPELTDEDLTVAVEGYLAGSEPVGDSRHGGG